ncbi:MAG: Gfo/Idh/MocA family protein [Candidatus Sumerlaeia bacterium]
MALNIGIVGLGGIGNNHARCYMDNRYTKVVAVCDIIKERADKAAEAYGAKAFYSVQDMLNSGIKLDACSMCTAGKENGGDHYVPTMELLEAGLPVLGEKPISNEVDKAKKMVALAKKKNIPYAIDLNHRFTPAALKARQWLDKGRLGNINMIDMTMWINNKNDTSPHFHMRALHPHSIDVMRYFCGDIEKVHAFFKKGEGRKCWSNVQVNMLFKSGVVGHLRGSYDATGPGGPYGLESCEVVGDKAKFMLLDACEKLTYTPRTSFETETYECLGGMRNFGETFASRIGAWVNDLRKGTPPDEIDGKGEDALRAQMVIEAAIESWDKGTVVTLKY